MLCDVTAPVADEASALMEICVAEAEKRNGRNTVNMQETFTVYLVETRWARPPLLGAVGIFIARSYCAVVHGCCYCVPRRPMDAVAEGRNPAPDSLWRRYSEFELLRNYLLVTYPYIVVPPLPEKRVRCYYYKQKNIHFVLVEKWRFSLKINAHFIYFNAWSFRRQEGSYMSPYHIYVVRLLHTKIITTKKDRTHFLLCDKSIYWNRPRSKIIRLFVPYIIKKMINQAEVTTKHRCRARSWIAGVSVFRPSGRVCVAQAVGWQHGPGLCGAPAGRAGELPASCGITPSPLQWQDSPPLPHWGTCCSSWPVNWHLLVRYIFQ